MNVKKTENKKNQSFLKLFFKILKIFIIGLLALIIIVSGTIYFYNDKIAKELLLSLNSVQNGEISFNDISFNPFVHFPNTSIKLHNVVYKGNKLDMDFNTNDTIAKINKLFVAIDILDLIQGDINVSKITLDEGEIKMIVHPDSTINIINAIGDFKRDEDKSNKLDQDAELNIFLKEITLKDILIQKIDSISNNYSEVKLKKIGASFSYQTDFIRSKLIALIEIIELPLTDKFKIGNKDFQVETEVVFDKNSLLIDLNQSKLIVDNARFDLSGSVDLSDDYNVDIVIDGSDSDFSFFNLLLTDTGLENLNSGDIYFKGTIKGPAKKNIPQFDFNFGLVDVNLYLPEVNQNIKGLNFEGHINSGLKGDFSDAFLQIINLKGQLPGGFVNAHISVENFVEPRFDVLWDLKTDLNGFEEVFKIESLDSLKGGFEIYNKTKGYYDLQLKKIVEEESVSKIVFDSLSFILTDVMQVKCLNGQIQQNLDTLVMNDFYLITDNSDFLINGTINNLYYLFIENENEIYSDLSIQSEIFDLPQFFAFEPIVGRSFPYRIVNMDLDFIAKTTADKLLNFEYNPEINFEIDRLNATIENLFPPISIEKGNVLLSEKEDRIFMDFYDFNLEVANANLLAQVEYFSPPVEPDYIEIEVDISNLNPGNLLFYKEDTIPQWANGNLNGHIKSDLEIGLDTMVFETFNIRAEKISYINTKDTFEIDNLNLKTNDVNYFTDTFSNPLATLSVIAFINASRVYTNYFEVTDIAYEINVVNGTYTIYPEQIQLFGKEGTGKYIASPFGEEPWYEFKYSVNQFQVDDLLVSMLSDTIITGRMNLDINVTLSEDRTEKLYENLNGYINLSGKDLILYGIEIDKVIEKYNRSQNFNLVDVGAVVVAGPYALFVTKGSDMARLALGNIGEKTPISNFISEWDIVNGKLILDDVAFSTEKNLIACNGYIDLANDTLDVTVAVLDKNGCRVISQSIYGLIEDPQQSEIEIVKTVLGPITNLIEGALGKNCEVFYDGEVKHPVKQKK